MSIVRVVLEETIGIDQRRRLPTMLSGLRHRFGYSYRRRGNLTYSKAHLMVASFSIIAGIEIG